MSAFVTLATVMAVKVKIFFLLELSCNKRLRISCDGFQSYYILYCYCYVCLSSDCSVDLATFYELDG
jgi:hypothetical protein